MPSSRRCVFGCVTKGLTVHSFPNPSKFPEQFRIWVELGGEKLKNLPVEEIYRRLKVCDKHFIQSHRNRNSRLNALAIPTLHLSLQQEKVPDSEIELQSDTLRISSPTPHSSCAPMTCKTKTDKLNNTEILDNIVNATKNNSKKENIQEEILIEMNVPAKSKKRWKLSQQRHNKGFKRLKSSRDGAKKPRPWRFEKQRLLRVKQLKSNLLRRVHTKKRDSNSTLNSLCSSENDVYTISYIAASSASSTFDDVTKRKDVEQKNEGKYLHSRESQVPRPNSSNAVHPFFTAMADIVVTFPPDVQLKIKNQLYSTVWQALELQQRPNVSESSSE